MTSILSFQAKGGYSEHGFLLVQAENPARTEDYWEPRGPGIYAGPGWVKIEGPQASVTCDYELVIYDTGHYSGEQGATLEVTDEQIIIWEPLDLRWWVPNGTYHVSAEILDSSEEELWRIKIARIA